MVLNILLGLGGVFAILVVAEILWNKRVIRGETARKAIHILVGVFVAFWPVFMSLGAIQLCSLAFLVVLLVSRKYKRLKSIHSIDRKTWGDILFAVGIGLSAFIVGGTGSSKWLFTLAILHLACADGFAAIMGRKAKINKKYHIFKSHPKSVAGSLAFLVTSAVLITAFTLSGQLGGQLSIVTLLLVPTTLTVIESVAIYGLDNLLIPLAVVGLLAPLVR